MELPSRRTLLQYIMVACIGYLIGNASPSTQKAATKMLISRYLSETGGEEATSEVHHESAVEGHEGKHEEVEEEEEEEEEEEHGFDFSSDEDVTVTVGIVLLLIFLTIAFEYIKEELEEKANSSLRPIIDKLFGELTVLGFLSMFTFVVTKAGFFEILSEKFFGEGEELLEIFEFVHFTIFFVMVFFVAQVLILVVEATETEKTWLKMDKMARDPELEDEYEEWAAEYMAKARTRNARPSVLRTLSEFCGSAFLGGRQQPEDLLMYKALRNEFVLERQPHPPFQPAPENQRVGKNFDFGRYLSVCMGHLLAQVVEVKIATWIVFAILSVVYYVYVILVNENIFLLAWSWVVLGWFVFGYNLYFESHLLGVRTKLLKKEIFLLGLVDDKSISGLTPDERTYLMNLDNPHSEADLPVWAHIDIDKYNKERSWINRWFSPVTPNRQQSLYWMDGGGPKFYLLILQSNLLFLGIFAAMNVLGFLQYMYTVAIWEFILYIVLSIIPLLGVMFLKQRLVAILAQISSVGSYRRPNVVADVLREEKTSHVVRAFIVIYKMRRFAENANHARKVDKSKKQDVQFDQVELEELGKTFDAFDTSGDGAISYDEFKSLMNNLGAEMTEESLNNMIAMLDEDGDGDVSKSEFISWYAENAADDDLSDEERAEYLFELFDNDKSGELTIGEFKRKLDALNVGFTVDEVGAIVNELDEDNNGTIGVEEFSNLLEKYYPQELRTTKGEHHSKSFRRLLSKTNLV